MTNRHPLAERDAATLLEAAAWLALWWPRRGLNGWLMRHILPPVCRQVFDEALAGFAAHPEEARKAVIDRLAHRLPDGELLIKGQIRPDC